MRILTGLQVTADQFHLGNYFGAVRPFMDMTIEYPDAEQYLFVANQHSFTTVQDGSLRQNTLNTLKLYLACGVSPDVTLYNQADIPGHTQLARVLTCLTHMGFMERMHAFKDKSSKTKANEIGVGLFTYPILMAADILLYDATHVPTGKDQKQHVEFARDIAQKFNSMYGDTFTLPESIIKKELAVLPGIDGRKMSKSYNNFIGMLDTPDILKKKIMRITTSPLPIEQPKNPDECNVYNILKLFLTQEEDHALRLRYEGGGLSFKTVKEELLEKTISFLSPIQQTFSQISDGEVITMLQKNGKIVNDYATKKIEDIYKKVGFSL